MSAPFDLGGFADVDASGAPAGYAAYLDEVRDLEAVREWKERSFDLLDPRPGAFLIDVGCGAGDDVGALARRVAPGGRVLGIDASEAMIQEARRRAAGASVGAAVGFLRADAERLEMPDAVADGCRVERTLQHLADPARAVGEMARVLRPGGRLVAAEPDWGTLVVDAGDPGVGRHVAAAAVGRLRSGGVGRTLRRLLLDAGLADVTVVARALVVTEPAHVASLFDLQDAARLAVEERRLTQAEADAWLAAVTARAEGGRLLAAMTAFMASGRKVGARAT